MASGFLTLTWNRVLKVFVKIPAVKYWQALLLLATLSSLVAPFCMIRKADSCRHRCEHRPGHGPHEMEEGKDCPYSRSKGEESPTGSRDRPE